MQALLPVCANLDDQFAIVPRVFADAFFLAEARAPPPFSCGIIRSLPRMLYFLAKPSVWLFATMPTDERGDSS